MSNPYYVWYHDMLKDLDRGIPAGLNPQLTEAPSEYQDFTVVPLEQQSLDNSVAEGSQLYDPGTSEGNDLFALPDSSSAVGYGSGNAAPDEEDFYAYTLSPDPVGNDLDQQDLTASLDFA